MYVKNILLDKVLQQLWYGGHASSRWLPYSFESIWRAQRWILMPYIYSSMRNEKFVKITLALKFANEVHRL